MSAALSNDATTQLQALYAEMLPDGQMGYGLEPGCRADLWLVHRCFL